MRQLCNPGVVNQFIKYHMIEIFFNLIILSHNLSFPCSGSVFRPASLHYFFLFFAGCVRRPQSDGGPGGFRGHDAKHQGQKLVQTRRESIAQPRGPEVKTRATGRTNGKHPALPASRRDEKERQTVSIDCFTSV